MNRAKFRCHSWCKFLPYHQSQPFFTTLFIIERKLKKPIPEELLHLNAAQNTIFAVLKFVIPALLAQGGPPKNYDVTRSLSDTFSEFSPNHFVFDTEKRKERVIIAVNFLI